MNILVINCGSSSLKFQLINSLNEETIAKGLCERIGMANSRLVYQAAPGEKSSAEVPMDDHLKAVQVVLGALCDAKSGVIGSFAEIGAVGHRIVHGGEDFSESVLISDEVIRVVEALNDLAPLHNPANLIGISACRELMPTVPMVAVFDTAFHQSMPEEAYLYALPYEYYERHKLRRYGFHGTSHAYVSQRATQLHKAVADSGRKTDDLKIIVCHLGNGASISAVRAGKSVDTSMGLTPLEGLIMGTRSGDMDPAIIEFLSLKEGISLHEVGDILNKKSGMLGLQGGVSSDFRDITADYEQGKDAAVRALHCYIYRLAKYIGAYTAAMCGVDIICFTAGVGENNALVRSLCCKYLTYLGLFIDPDANQVSGEERIISTKESSVCVMVIPTNEELMIARDTKRVVEGSK